MFIDVNNENNKIDKVVFNNASPVFWEMDPSCMECRFWRCGSVCSTRNAFIHRLASVQIQFSFSVI